MGAQPWTAVPDGVLVRVRLTPKGGRDALDGMRLLGDGTAVLKARVRAAPQDGEANAALLALLADGLGLGKSRIVLAAGAAGKLKTVRIDGDPAQLAAALDALAPPSRLA